VEVTPLPSATAETASATPEPPPDPLKNVVELPAKSACILGGPWGGRKWETPLVARAAGPALANVMGGRAKLHFPVGPRAAVQGLEIEADGIALRGYVASDAADLRAARPFLIDGFLVPGIFTKLAWTEAKEGELTVTTETPAALEVVAGPIVAKTPCADIGMGRAAFNAEDAVPGAAKAKQKELVADKAIDIALTPGGPAVARAHPTKGGTEVGVLETKGQLARIWWPVGTMYVVGWVAKSSVRERGAGTGYGSGSGRLAGRHISDSYKKVACEEDVPLVVEAGGERVVAGVIRAGTTMELIATLDGLTNIRVRSSAIAPADGATWFAPSSRVDGCPEPPPK
jgi:hypothetical protein